MCEDCVAVAREHKDAKQGGDGWIGWEETPYRKSSVKKKRKKAKGCPENNGGAHVYIWIDWDTRWPWSDATYEIKVCCGCLHRAPNKSFRRKV